jgi:hypothetical protein
LHLDIITSNVSTHSAIADMPAPVTGIAPGAPGNPYDAYAAPGTPIRLVVTVPAGTLGMAPIGAGSPISIAWSVGAFPVVNPFVGLFWPTCAVAEPILGVLPLGGTIVDGVGLFGPAPLVPTADPGFPQTFSITLRLPPFALPPVNFQAIMMTPLGLAVTNAASVISGPDFAELDLVPLLVPNAALPATNEGQALGIATPPGFTFYGVPTPACDVDVNGFLDFCPGAAGCGGNDVSSGASAAGCVPVSALVRPRINVDHYNIDLAVAPPAPMVSGLTVVFAPPGPGRPARTIVRWKNVMQSGATPGSGLQTSFTAELWGDSRIALQRHGGLVGPIGIGPGGVGQGFGGPSPGLGDTCGLVGGLSFAPLWTLPGGIPGFLGGPFGVIEQDAGAFQLALNNLAVVFTPMPGAAYLVSTY